MSRRADATENLAVLHPEVARQWHPAKNGDVRPTDVRPGSAKRFWWRCQAGHEWQTAVHNRTRGRGCPYCAGQRPSAAHNLAVVLPAVAAEWHPTRNGDVTPTTITPSSRRKVWWQCAAGHEWEGSVDSREAGRSGCPYCARKRPSPEWNLAVCHPDVAAEWHSTKNRPVTPDLVLPQANRRFWWRCPSGHEWLTPVASRTKGKTGCPRCAYRGRKGIVLAVKAPELLDEWDTIANGGPGHEVAAGSHRRVWWRCRVNPAHRWAGDLHDRAYRGVGCPYCAGQRSSPEHNFAVRYPDLAAEWHSTRNGDLFPTDVTPHANRYVWWRCDAGHEWEASVNERAYQTRCPFCAGDLASPTRNLAVCHPDVAAEWHPTRNGDLSPADVTPGSDTRVWWECLTEGHEWPARIGDRTRGRAGCPYCAGKRCSLTESLVAFYPEVAAEWHPTRNGELLPTTVRSATNMRVWWRCPARHEWEARISDRAGGKGCPYCADVARADRRDARDHSRVTR